MTALGILEEFLLLSGDAGLQKPMLSPEGPVLATNCPHLRKNIGTKWGTPKFPPYSLHTAGIPLGLFPVTAQSSMPSH